MFGIAERDLPQMMFAEVGCNQEEQPNYKLYFKDNSISNSFNFLQKERESRGPIIILFMVVYNIVLNKS